MKSPGAPSLRRDVEKQFWGEIGKGFTSEDAAVAVGVSQAAGSRWFRERGGMPSFMLAPTTGRFLSFATPCGSRTRRSIRRSTCRAEVRCDASSSRVCGPGGQCECPVHVPVGGARSSSRLRS